MVARSGDMAGRNTQSIVGCCALRISVSGDRYVGGLVGINYGSEARIEASYVQGDVRGADYVGGLVGANAGCPFRGAASLMAVADPVAVVWDCYAVCSVTGENQVGGCIGYALDSAVQEGCYFLDPNDGGGPDNGHAAALSAVAMRQQVSFVDWDFETVWMICEGEDYPQLQWEGTACQE